MGTVVCGILAAVSKSAGVTPVEVRVLSSAVIHFAAVNVIGIGPFFMLRICVLTVVICIAGWALFGPVGGFHHHIGFGILMYMVWNGEDPDPERFQIVEGYEVGFSPERFVLSVVLWLAFAGVAIWISRPERPQS